MTASHLITDLPSLFQVRVAWAVRHRWNAGETLAQQQPGAVSFWMVEEGALQVASEKTTYLLHQGDCLLWPAAMVRTITAGELPKSTFGAQWITLGLSAQLFGQRDVMTLLPAPHRWQPDVADFEQWRSLCDHIAAIAKNPTAAKVLLRDGYCRVLVAQLWETLREEDLLLASSQALPEWLQKSLAFAQQNPGATVADLTRVAAFSPAQFRRAFAQWMHLSPRQYLQNLRLEAARRLLEHTDLSASAIAEQLQFASATHFGRLWKKSQGLSPAAYRRAVRSRHWDV